MPTFLIQPDEDFPPLAQAPVTEAVLELRGRAETPWEQKPISAALKEKLPEFARSESIREFVTEMHFPPDSPMAQRSEEVGWTGMRFHRTDGRQIVRFERDTFVFSQLAPYPGWDWFVTEALRFWSIHEEVAGPAEIARIGLRFINRITLTETGGDLEAILVVPPRQPDGLPLPMAGFLHRDQFSVPGHDYSVQITRAVQPAAEGTSNRPGLIIDIDVATSRPWTGNGEGLRKRLLDMRWLKNKAFFGSLTEAAKSQLA